MRGKIRQFIAFPHEIERCWVQRALSDRLKRGMVFVRKNKKSGGVLRQRHAQPHPISIYSFTFEGGRLAWIGSCKIRPQLRNQARQLHAVILLLPFVVGVHRFNQTWLESAKEAGEISGPRTLFIHYTQTSADARESALDL